MSAAPLIPVYPPLETGALRRPHPRRPAAFPFGEPGLRPTHLGRGAVWLALEALGVGAGSRVAMPAYHCGSEVEAVRLAGAEVRFYRVRGDLGVDDEDMARVAADCDVVYVISHFGFPVAAAPEGATVVEDAAHALFSEDPAGRPVGAGGDAAIFCPRKSLGVPDGGAVLLRGATPADTGRPPAKRIVRSSVALLAGRGAVARPAPVRRAARALIDRASKGDAAARAGNVTETVIGEWDLEVADMENAARLPARLTEAITARVDGAEVRARRRANYLRLLAALEEHVPQRYRELPELTCPLYVPVRAADRPAALRTLLDHGVRTLEIWPVPHPLLDRERFAELEPARRELLALPVHQHLTDAHLEQVLAAARAALER